MSAATLATPAPEAAAGAAAPAAERPAEGDKPFTFSSSVQYASPQDAQMVKAALDVDAELRPEAVSRQLTVEGSTLLIAVDARVLRAAVGTFCDLLGLATRTLEAFGGEQPAEQPAAQQ